MSIRKLINEMAGVKPKGNFVGFTRLDEKAPFRPGDKVKISKKGHDWDGKTGMVYKGSKSDSKNGIFAVSIAGTNAADHFSKNELTLTEARNKNRFWLVMNATPNSELNDVVAEVDVVDLARMVQGGRPDDALREDWELFPHNAKAQAMELANQRIEMAIRSRDPFLHRR